MFYKSLMVLGFVIFGLTGCSKPAIADIADSIVTEDAFKSTLDLCRVTDPSSNPARCMLDNYDPISEKHCSKYKLSTDECSELTHQVVVRLNKFMKVDHDKRLRELFPPK